MNKGTMFALGLLTVVGTLGVLGSQAAFAAEEIGTYTARNGEEVTKYEMNAEVVSISEDGRPVLVTLKDTDTGDEYTMPGGRYFEDNDISEGETVDMVFADVPEEARIKDEGVNAIPLEVNGEELPKGPRGGMHRGEGEGRGMMERDGDCLLAE